jgi:RNA polymerase sigma-70 factor, ECF subfamily
MSDGANAPGGAEADEASELVDLLRRVAARDEAAFSALYKRTNAKLYGIVARILTRGDAGAEALQ